MFKQLDIQFDLPAGEHLAEVGLELAVESADRKEKDWSKKCWQLFLWWMRRNIKRGGEFMVEDFRKHVKEYGLLEDPPSNRAFGFVSKRALNGGWIVFSRVASVKNKKAHAARATMWRKL